MANHLASQPAFPIQQQNLKFLKKKPWCCKINAAPRLLMMIKMWFSISFLPSDTVTSGYNCYRLKRLNKRVFFKCANNCNNQQTPSAWSLKNLNNHETNPQYLTLYRTNATQSPFQVNTTVPSTICWKWPFQWRCDYYIFLWVDPTGRNVSPQK